MDPGLVSIVLPVYNQGDHIAKVVREYEQHLSDLPLHHELLLVPNGCKDDSLRKCRDLSREYPTVRVVASEKGGWGLAIRLGLREARGGLICYTNSARTDGADLRLLLDYALEHPDTVIKACRTLRDNWRRQLGSLLFNLECKLLFDLSSRDVNGTPKVFPRSFDKLLSLQRDDDLIDAEFTAICRRESYPIIEVPLASTRRHGGASTTRYRSALRMYKGAFQLWRSLERKEDHA